MFLFQFFSFTVRVSDPHWFNADPDTDPDPAFFLIADLDPGFDDLKFKKIYSWKLNFLFSWSKIAIYLSLGLHKGRPSYRRSLQLSKENIKHFKTWKFCTFFYFCGSLLPSWIRIRIRIYGTSNPNLRNFLLSSTKMKGVYNISHTV